MSMLHFRSGQRVLCSIRIDMPRFFVRCSFGVNAFEYYMFLPILFSRFRSLDPAWLASRLGMVALPPPFASPAAPRPWLCLLHRRWGVVVVGAGAGADRRLLAAALERRREGWNTPVTVSRSCIDTTVSHEINSLVEY